MNDKISGPNRAKKEKIVAELCEKVSRSKGMVFTNYQGLTHLQLEKLKKKVKTMDADFIVTKNTLLKLAIKKTPFDTSDTSSTFDTFAGATATLFLYGDSAPPLKEVVRAIKEFNLPVIKFGILDGQTLSEAEVLKLSALPSRETLLTHLVFGLKSPIFNLHRALNWNLQKLLMTLKAIETKGVN